MSDINGLRRKKKKTTTRTTTNDEEDIMGDNIIIICSNPGTVDHSGAPEDEQTRGFSAVSCSTSSFVCSSCVQSEETRAPLKSCCAAP